MDFASIISQTDRYNFHSHTQFCDGKAPMEQFAARALNEGFLHYGFSPHSPVPIASPCNMDAEQVPLFFDEVSRLKELYANRPITFYAAMEIDYLGDNWGPAHPYFRQLPLDYRIGSVHFIPSQQGDLIDIDGRFDSFKIKMSQHFHDDIYYVIDTFFTQSQKMIEAGGFDIIGHFDKISHNASHFSPGIENSSFYLERVNSLVETIVSSGIIVEINTKAWIDHKRFFPNPKLWKRLKDAGVTLIVNSDAHQPPLINASRDYVLEKIAKL